MSQQQEYKESEKRAQPLAHALEDRPNALKHQLEAPFDYTSCEMYAA